MATVTVTATDQSGRTGTISFTVHDEAAARDALAAAGYNAYPAGPGFSGVLSDRPRRRVQSLTTVPGQEYANLVLPFDFTPPKAPFDAPPVVLRNVEIVGPPGAPAANGALLRCWNQGRARVKLIDSTINPQTPHFWRNGILGADFELVRTEVTRVVDCVSTYDTASPARDLRVSARGHWFHDLAWFSQAVHLAGGGSSPADGSHSDCWQMQSGIVGEIAGGRMEGFIGAELGPNIQGTNHTTSVFLIKNNVGPISGLNIHHNRLDGGAFTVNFANASSSNRLGNVGALRDNRFGRNSRLGVEISMPSNVTGDTSGNVFDDTGAPVVAHHNG